MNKSRFTLNHFSYVCPMQWDDMKEVSGGRFCHKCKITVVDVTDCSLDEVAEMQRKDKHLCVALRTVLTTGLALGAASCSQNPQPPMVTAGVPAPIERPHQQHESDNKKTEKGSGKSSLKQKQSSSPSPKSCPVDGKKKAK